MSELTPVLVAASELVSFCRERDWPSCLIGGLAVQRWGEPRFTRDADLTLLTGFGSESVFIDELVGNFAPRRADAAEFAQRARVVLLKAGNGVDLDVALGALPFEERSVKRSSDYAFRESCVLPTCSAEDLIVHKVFAGRDRDWADVRGVLSRQGKQLDLSLIRKELCPLLEAKEDSESMEKFERLASGL
ncbi:MAG: nucleotidyl transferase AbiEii/AbiGii toxin family protein [Chthoniobacterales bacterium]|nr:nucleotidyl transferase AbiEii/AbiGii toxin family protein [Chthoniobacterales bacterium]